MPINFTQVDNQEMIFIMFEKYFLTGASGFLGKEILKRLKELNAEIYALILPNEAKAFDSDGITVIPGDVRKIEEVEKFLEKADKNSCVIHSAGIISIASKPSPALFEVNVTGTENISFVCLSKHIGKLVYISSVHALPDKRTNGGFCTKNKLDVTRAEGDYGKSKAMATNVVLDAVEKGLNATIVMPSGIIGPNDRADGNIGFMLRSFIKGKLPLAIKGGYDFVDVRDVAAGILAAAEKGREGKCYVLSGRYASIKDVLDTVRPLALVKKEVHYLPIKIAKCIAPIYEKYSIKKKLPLIFTPYSVAVLASNGNFSNADAKKELGFSPRDLSETLYDTVEWIKYTFKNGK